MAESPATLVGLQLANSQVEFLVLLYRLQFNQRSISKSDSQEQLDIENWILGAFLQSSAS